MIPILTTLCGISIHTAFAGCDGVAQHVVIALVISIHTAFAGCDGVAALDAAYGQISIHTAFAGCDADGRVYFRIDKIFQSTQPSQAVTESGTTEA